MHKLLLLMLFPFVLYVPKTKTIKAADGVDVTIDEYLVSDTSTYIVLCHQAGYSRGEYPETATKLNKLGYNCIALDARSGKGVNNVWNQTAINAKQAGKSTTYLDAEQDIVAVGNYAYKKSNKKIILLGSSYSASLALKISTTNAEIKAVVAFSPGEYFGDKLNLKSAIALLDKPVFVTSSKTEATEVTALVKDVKSKMVTQFIPATAEGIHGASALWFSTPNYNEYWIALIGFLNKQR